MERVTRPSTQLLLLLLTLFIIMVGFGIVIPTLPFLARQVGASPVEMGLLVTVWAVAQLLTAPLWGNLSDRVGRKPVLIAGLLGYGVSFFLMAAAPSYPMLLLARLAGGLLSAAALPTALALAADLTPPENRGAAMGQMGGAFGLGFLFGPAIGGVLAPLGITVPFIAAGILALAAVPLGAIVLREPLRHRSPIVSQPLWRSLWQAVRSPYALLYWLAFGMTFGASAMFAMLGYYFIDRVHGSPAQVGLTFTLVGLAASLIQFTAIGPASRAWGENRVAQTGLLLGAIGFAVIALSGTTAPLIASVVVTGIGMSLTRPAITSLLSKRTQHGQGLTMGVQTSFDSLGRTVGPLWAGAIYVWDIRAPFLSASAVFLAFLLIMLTSAARASLGPEP